MANSIAQDFVSGAANITGTAAHGFSQLPNSAKAGTVAVVSGGVCATSLVATVVFKLLGLVIGGSVLATAATISGTIFLVGAAAGTVALGYLFVRAVAAFSSN